MHDRVCTVCGKTFSANHCEIYCSDKCRKEGMNRYVTERRNILYGNELKQEQRREKPKISIGEISVLARKEGLTYGQYVVKHRL